ncbi:MAG: PAS domain S-box protein [Anaerolineae bacterium]|nr:PAS domain S-box protein [Anaerolineae bacterium]
MRANVNSGLDVYVESLRGKRDWAETSKQHSQVALSRGAPATTLAKSSRFTYLVVQEILASQRPARHLEWLSILGNHWLLSSQMATEALEANLEKLVAQRTQEALLFRQFAEAAGQGLAMTTLDGLMAYANPTFCRMVEETNRDEILGKSAFMFHPEESHAKIRDEVLPTVMEKGQWVGELFLLSKSGRIIPTLESFFLIRDDRGSPVYMANMITDLTEQKQAEADRARSQDEIIQAQEATLREISTPIIPVMQGIIVMPLIGHIDTGRARDITRWLLAGVSEYRAKIVIIDITGVAVVDSGVADHLNKTIQAARLKGAQTIITGISDAVAETVVDLGIDWSDIDTLRDLQTGLLAAVRRLDIKLEQ